MTFKPTKFPKPPAEVFCPGEFISDELLARMWGRAKFAHETRLPIEYVNGLLAGTEPLTNGPAQRIAQVFGTSVALWTRLERAYRTHLAAKPKPAKKPAKKSTKSLLSQAPRRITRFVPRPGQKARPVLQIVGISTSRTGYLPPARAGKGGRK